MQEPTELTVKPVTKKVDYHRARASNLWTKYRLRVEQYNDLLQSQQGVCAICHKECTVKRSLAVDHNHETGKIRGLLCSKCNQALGLLGTIENLKNAITYLEKNDG